MYMEGSGLMGLGGMGYVLVFMIFLWVLVLLGAIYIIRYIGTFYRWEKEKETSEEVLMRRFVNGYSKKEEFDEKMRITADSR